MAKLPGLEMNMTAFDEWVASRPPVVQEIIRKLPPDRLYRMKSTGHRVTLIAYAEDGTVRVNVSGQFNFVMFDRQVFGVKADDLEECDLPKAGEQTGTVLTGDEDVKDYIDAMRDDVLRKRNEN